MKGERSLLHRLGGLVLGVFLLPGMVAVATEFWLRGDGNTTSRHLGLWKICGETDCAALSADIIADWLSSVRGLCVMALCFHVISVATGCCCACLGSHELSSFSFMSRVEEASAVTGGFFMAGGVAVFAQISLTHPEFRHFHFDWSFWLCLSYICVLILCGGIIALARDDCACQMHHRCCRPGKHVSVNYKHCSKRRLRVVPNCFTTPRYHQESLRHWEQEQGGRHSTTVNVSWEDSGTMTLAEPVQKCQTVIIFSDMSAADCPNGRDAEGFVSEGKASELGQKCFSSYEGTPFLLNTVSGEKK